METQEYIQVIETQAPVDLVLSIVSEIQNLPRWTTFFAAIGGRLEQGYAVTTLVGPAVTWIEHTASELAAQVDICSKLNGRLEKARVRLRPTAAGSGTHISFEVQLPIAWGEERIQAQLGAMTRELECLRQLCEAPSDRISTSIPLRD